MPPVPPEPPLPPDPPLEPPVPPAPPLPAAPPDPPVNPPLPDAPPFLLGLEQAPSSRHIATMAETRMKPPAVAMRASYSGTRCVRLARAGQNLGAREVLKPPRDDAANDLQARSLA